jgi:hypothetical protein
MKSGARPIGAIQSTHFSSAACCTACSIRPVQKTGGPVQGVTEPITAATSDHNWSVHGRPFLGCHLISPRPRWMFPSLTSLHHRVHRVHRLKTLSFLARHRVHVHPIHRVHPTYLVTDLVEVHLMHRVHVHPMVT